MLASHRGTLGALLCVCALGLGACSGADAQHPTAPKAEAPKGQVKISVREGKVRQFPCMQCHDKVAADNPTPPLEGKHRDLKMAHFEGAEHCATCHNKENMDTLRLLTGKAVSMNSVYEVCGQCHAARLKDWQIGAHGKEVGSWRGERHKYNCTDCHDAHSPGFGLVKADPAPPFPKLGIPKEAHP